MAKNFKAVETPVRRPNAAESVLAFVNNGQAAQAAAVEAGAKEPTARLSLDVPEGLHSRFKAACALKRLKMTGELLAFMERRAAELEKSS